MAFTCGFFNSQNGDRKYNAKQMASIFDGLIKDGVYDTVGEIFAVTPGTGMQVLVGSGRAWFDHTWNNNDAPYPLAITDADVSLPRYDAVVLETNHSDEVRTNRLRVLTGTPASTPIKPTMTSTANVNQHPLAYIKVTAGATAITQSMIEVVVGTSECPFVTGIIDTAQIDSLFQQWNGEFNEWFDNLKAQLSDNVVANLQKQIDDKVDKADVATAADIDAGTSDTKWVTPKGLKDADISSDGTKVGDVLCTARTDLSDDWALCNGDVIQRGLYPKLDMVIPDEGPNLLVPYEKRINKNDVVNLIKTIDSTATDCSIGFLNVHDNSIAFIAEATFNVSGNTRYAKYAIYGTLENPIVSIAKISDSFGQYSRAHFLIFDNGQYILGYTDPPLTGTSFSLQFFYTSKQDKHFWASSPNSYTIYNGSNVNPSREANYIGNFSGYNFVGISSATNSSVYTGICELIYFNDITLPNGILSTNIDPEPTSRGNIYYFCRLLAKDNSIIIGMDYIWNGNWFLQVLKMDIPSSGISNNMSFLTMTSLGLGKTNTIFSNGTFMNGNLATFTFWIDNTTHYNMTFTGLDITKASPGTSVNPEYKYLLIPKSEVSWSGGRIAFTENGCLSFGSPDIVSINISDIESKGPYNIRSLGEKLYLLSHDIDSNYALYGDGTDFKLFKITNASHTMLLPAITSDKTYNYIKVK